MCMFLRLFLFVLLESQADANAGDFNASILLMVSTSARFNSSGAVSAVELALERIRDDESVLKGLTLQVSNVTDSKCDGPSALREFLSQVRQSSPTIIGVIGCGCSVATEPVAEITPLYGLPLITYTPDVIVSTDASVSGRFQLYPSERNLVSALLAVVEEYNWTQISVLTQNEQPFIRVQKVIAEVFSRANVTVLPSSSFTTDQDVSDVKRLLIEDSHINFVNCFEDKAVEIICGASKLSMKYPAYAWILYGWYSENWWRLVSNVNCTEDEIAAVLQRALIIQQHSKILNSSSVAKEKTQVHSTIINRTLQHFVEMLAYDSVWTLALALNRTMNAISNNDTLDCGTPSLPLHQFSYGNSSTACIIRQSLLMTNFTGLSGLIQFNSFGVRQTKYVVTILQYRPSNKPLELHQFAYIIVDEENTTLMYLEAESVSTVWPEGIPPDGSTIIILSLFHIAAVTVMYAFGFGGIIFSIFCLIFNILFRKRRIVRLTSPNLNYIILAGALLMYGSAFIRMPYTRNLMVWDFSCKAGGVFNSIGYTLLFGPILAKMWRIYYIFHNPSSKKKNITDWHLGIFVAVVVAIVLVLLVIGFSIPATRPRPFIAPDGENHDTRNEQGILQTFTIVNCYPMALTWVPFLYLYLGVLQIAGLVLAVKSRIVKIKVLNDSKEVALIVYITTFAAVETAIVGIALGNYNNVGESLFIGHMLVATTAIVVITFVPKMIAQCRDPKGEKVFSKNANETTVTKETPSSRGEKTKIATMEQKSN